MRGVLFRSRCRDARQGAGPRRRSASGGTAGEIDRVYRRMLIAAEDQRFAEHPGIDPIAALRALGQLALHGHIVSGASTLTMQAVGLFERRPRGGSGQIIQITQAVGLERRAADAGKPAASLTPAARGGPAPS